MELEKTKIDTKIETGIETKIERGIETGEKTETSRIDGNLKNIEEKSIQSQINLLKKFDEYGMLTPNDKAKLEEIEKGKKEINDLTRNQLKEIIIMKLENGFNVRNSEDYTNFVKSCELIGISPEKLPNFNDGLFLYDKLIFKLSDDKDCIFLYNSTGYVGKIETIDHSKDNERIFYKKTPDNSIKKGISKRRISAELKKLPNYKLLEREVNLLEETDIKDEESLYDIFTLAREKNIAYEIITYTSKNDIVKRNEEYDTIRNFDKLEQVKEFIESIGE